ncbi:MAG: hypothetical protein JRM77_07540 [Nitrososphaerota archaeon]|jgi:hypothetical protein|nr:hypothetical protein [Nitrososphaerota archaeon]
MSQSDRAKALIKDMEAYFRAAKENEGEDGMKTQQPYEGGSPDSAKAHLGAGKEHEGHNEGSGNRVLTSIPSPSGQIRPELWGKPGPEIQEALFS